MPQQMRRGPKPETQMNRPLPNRIRQNRLSRDLTMKECANRLSISVAAMQKAETLDHLSREHRYQLADWWEMDPRELENDWSEKKSR